MGEKQVHHGSVDIRVEVTRRVNFVLCGLIHYYCSVFIRVIRKFQFSGSIFNFVQRVV